MCSYKGRKFPTKNLYLVYIYIFFFWGGGEGGLVLGGGGRSVNYFFFEYSVYLCGVSFLFLFYGGSK